jgi:hypothetical protein
LDKPSFQHLSRLPAISVGTVGCGCGQDPTPICRCEAAAILQIRTPASRFRPEEHTMKSPFAIFRKNARVLTVVLTGLAMFAFVVMDQLRSNPQLFPILMAGLLLGTAFWILGRPSGRGNVYGVGGLLLGVVLMAYVVPMFTRPDAAVELTIGNLSKQDVAEYVRRRNAANDFVAAVRRETNQLPSQPPFGFGADGTDSAAMSFILRHEADEMGIGLSDKAVNDFIMQETARKLTQKQFKDIRTKMRLSETELYDILRENLRANLALQMLVPRDYTTPAQFWKYYQQLNVKQEVAIAEIPISAFLEDIPKPGDDEIIALFEQYKNNADTGLLTPEPAFKQPRKIRIAYLEIDYEQIRTRLQDKVSDKDVEDFYEENKAIRYREQSEFNAQPPLFDLSISPDEDKADEDKAEAVKPDEDKPIEPELNDDRPEKKQPPKTDAPKAEAPSKDAPEEKPDDAAKSNGDGKADDGAQFSVSDDGTVGSNADADDEPTPPALPEYPVGPVEAPIPSFWYLRLDEELFEDIYDELLHGRVLDEAQVIRENAEEFIQAIEDEFIIGAESTKEPTTEEKAAQAKKIELKVHEYANSVEGLRYEGQLELLGFLQLTEKGKEADKLWNEIHGAEAQPEDDDLPTLKYLVAQAIEFRVTNDFGRPEPLITLQVLFRGEMGHLYDAESAQDPISNNQYIYWKLEDKAVEVPKLDDPGIREQVVTAWKERQARPLALEQATKLAARVRKALENDQTMEEALQGKTVTGKPDSVELTVLDTGESFSWRTIPTAQSPMAFIKPRPTLSTIAAVDKAGNDFMRMAFDGLDVGEVGIAPNADVTAYHIILVKNRTPPEPDGDARFKEDFTKETLFGSYIPQLSGATSTYYYLTNGNQGAVTNRWRQSLLKKYDYKRSK